MTTNKNIEEIEQLLNQLLENDPEYFCVGIRIKPINNIKILLEGDKGLAIEKCVQFNRKLYQLIEEKELYPLGDFSLEVSSPGIDEPLKSHRQYIKNIGRDVEILFNDGSRSTGKLMEVTDGDIILESIQGKGKKAVIQKLVIPFNNIKTTTVQIKF